MRPTGRHLAVVAVGLYLVVVTPQLDRPLMYDDANFALAIQATATTGLPYGNQGWMSDRGDFSQREQWALWHPPLYIYADAAIVKLTEATPRAMRLMALLAGVISAALMYRLAADLTRGPPAVKSLAGGLAVTLAVLCPLYVQSTLILDIDFALLLPLMLGLLLAYIHLESRGRAVLWLAGLFAVMLWTKMTNPLPLIGVITVWQLLRGRPRRALGHLLAIGVPGCALFAVSWFVVGRASGFPLDRPFSVNLVEWRDSAEVARRAYLSPDAFVAAFQPTVLWLGPALVGLGLLAAAWRGAHLVERWHIVRADLLIGLLMIFIVGYVNKNAGWFPKYQVAFVPLLACLCAPVVTRAWCIRPLAATVSAGVALVLSGLVTGLLVGDRWALERTWQIDGLAACLLGLLTVAAPLALVRTTPASGLLAALVGLSLGWSVALDLLQLRAPYATTYWYGTSGTTETAAWVDQHVAPDETYLAAKEVAIRTHAARYVDQENVWSALEHGLPVDDTWAGQPLRVLVTWQRDPAIGALLQPYVATHRFRESARFGDYVIYERG